MRGRGEGSRRGRSQEEGGVKKREGSIRGEGMRKGHEEGRKGKRKG